MKRLGKVLDMKESWIWSYTVDVYDIVVLDQRRNIRNDN